MNPARLNRNCLLLPQAHADPPAAPPELVAQPPEKLREQLRRVRVLRRFRGEEIVGKLVVVPLINRLIPILPARFVDPELATGVVYSVPAHAPYDWMALKELKDSLDSLPENIRRLVEPLHPISIIKVEGYGEHPAVEICEKMNIKSQDDPALEEATREIYSHEYHSGVMKDECVHIAGLRVVEAKEEIKRILAENGLGDRMYDLPELVICRCGTRCIVKILSDQWSLKYSDEEWKRAAKEAIGRMAFYPEEVRKQFLYYVDWYRDWPCTRKTGLGTPFPYDTKWIVETLTDSTIYMAYYTIAKYLESGAFKPEQLSPEVFDYIFLNKGDPGHVASAT
jgi:leucyl-tRNA synthetase